MGAVEARYDKAAQCLAEDRDARLAFYDMPAEPWKHVRSTNVVESTFATVRLRTRQDRGLPVTRDRPRHGLQARHRPTVGPTRYRKQ